MAEFIYIKSEPETWTVGHYAGGEFVTESDHTSAEEAAQRVRYLNGGPVTELPGQGSVAVMSQRDYFAAMALTGLYVSDAIARHADDYPQASHEALVSRSYRVADLMLAERAKTKETDTDE